MDIKSTVVGHEKQREFLARSAASGRLAHAYIFSGPDGVGKKAVALELAAMLLCEKRNGCGECGQCRTAAAGSNPDLIVLDGSDSIKIEQVRELVYKLSLKSYAGGNKIAIIDQAELMTTEASNALLKAMEEPTSGTHLFLITSNAYRLLPTISSRAQRISFGLVADEAIEPLLGGADQGKRSAILSLSAGRPGIAVRYTAETDFDQAIGRLETFYGVFSGSDPVAKLQSAYELAEQETSDIRAALEYVLNKLEKELQEHAKTETARKMSGLSASLRYLSSNVNPKLLLFNLMLNS
ncbi:MAG: AAA family ATPase [Candidatus Saccharibacteria bacterium]